MYEVEDPNKTSAKRVGKMIVNGLGAFIFGLGTGWCVTRLSGNATPSSPDDPFSEFIGGVYLLLAVCAIAFLVCLVSLITTLLRTNDDEPFMR